MRESYFGSSIAFELANKDILCDSIYDLTGGNMVLRFRLFEDDFMSFKRQRQQMGVATGSFDKGMGRE